MLKQVSVCVVVGLVVIGFGVQNASALPPFNKEWKSRYEEGNGNAKFVAAAEEVKCNVCHMGTSKKDRNDYGKAVSKYLTKAKYNEIKEDEAAAKKYILEGLTKAEGEKNGGGKTFGELIKAGQLPGGE